VSRQYIRVSFLATVIRQLQAQPFGFIHSPITPLRNRGFRNLYDYFSLNVIMETVMKKDMVNGYVACVNVDKYLKSSV
jgi:hypothetical protein